MAEHLSGRGAKHVRRYGLHTLVWFEAYESREDALVVETRMKRWTRAIKTDVVERMNPAWADISGEWLDEAASTPTW